MLPENERVCPVTTEAHYWTTTLVSCRYICEECGAMATPAQAEDEDDRRADNAARG